MPATAITGRGTASVFTRRRGTRLQLLLSVLWLGLATHNTQAQALLRLTFSEGIPAAHSYSTRAPLNLAVVDGEEVILERASGRDYRLEASNAAWAWTQVQQIPRDSSSLKLTPSRLANGVLLQVSYRAREGDEVIAYTSTVSGEMGEWIVLLGSERERSKDGGRRYATASGTPDLAVKVELAAP
ncbi:MAG: hypothetical protein R3E54_14115 [Halioglobus sp.]